MGGNVLYTLTVLFSLITGTAAAILSVLLVEILNRSPFGRAVLVLSLLMVLFVGYHALLFLSPEDLMIVKTLKSGTFTVAAIFVWLMVWNQHRIRRQATEGVDN